MEEIKTLVNYGASVPKRHIIGTNIIYDGFEEPINKEHLLNFQKNIENTFTEYVYPAVFTEYTGASFISEQNLYRLRVWANIYRLYKDKRSSDYNLYYIYRLFLKAKQYGSK